MLIQLVIVYHLTIFDEISQIEEKLLQHIIKSLTY